jgi:hypothetical protein
MVGLPSSGKTTFLAALRYVLTNQRKGSEVLSVRNFKANRSYLHSISEQWMRCEQVERTSRSDRPVTVDLPLRDEAGREVDLVIPDLSGELFQGLWEERTWPTDLIEIIENSGATLFFVHPDHQLHAPLIEDAVDQAALAASGSSLTDLRTDQEEAPRDLNLAEVDAVVQMIDILQSLLRIRPPSYPRALAIVVSAWDRVPGLYAKPEAFVEKAAPLLHQYLLAQGDTRPVRYWGISAQGGQYPKDTDELAEVESPDERIIVVSADGETSHDLWRPVAWLLRETQE